MPENIQSDDQKHILPKKGLWARNQNQNKDGGLRLQPDPRVNRLVCQSHLTKC